MHQSLFFDVHPVLPVEKIFYVRGDKYDVLPVLWLSKHKQLVLEPALVLNQHLNRRGQKVTTEQCGSFTCINDGRDYFMWDLIGFLSFFFFFFLSLCFSLMYFCRC